MDSVSQCYLGEKHIIDRFVFCFLWLLIKDVMLRFTRGDFRSSKDDIYRLVFNLYKSPNLLLTLQGIFSERKNRILRYESAIDQPN